MLALRTIASLGALAPDQLGYALPLVVPVVTNSMTDTKKEVAEAAKAAMTAACDVIGNRDIEHMTPFIIKSFTHPDEVPEIMHNLAGVTFVQSVQSPALAMVVPLLIKGTSTSVIRTLSVSSFVYNSLFVMYHFVTTHFAFIPSSFFYFKRSSFTHYCNSSSECCDHRQHVKTC